MKWLFAIVGIGLAGGLGYVMEPALRPTLVKSSARLSPGTPPGKSEPAQGQDPAIEGDEAPATLPIGSPPEHLATADPVFPTDSLDEIPEDHFSGDPVMPSDPSLPAVDSEIVASDPPIEMPDAPPAPVEENPAAATEPVAPQDVVSIMKASIESEQIKEFKFDQVTKWEAGEPETVNGEQFDTGTLEYRTITMFGTRDMVAKAFIKDGAVIRWIWPNSQMEIH